MAISPSYANCRECNTTARVVSSNPVWSGGHDETTRRITDVEYAPYGIQSGWLPR